MKHIFTAILLVFSLHTGLTYSALAEHKKASFIPDIDWLKSAKVYKFKSELHILLMCLPLCPKNKRKIYTDSLLLMKKMGISVDLLIEELIAYAAINDTNDLENFCIHLRLALAPKKKEYYSEHLIKLTELEKKLFIAINADDVDKVRELLSSGARANAQDKDSYSALELAIKYIFPFSLPGNDKVMKLLLRQPNINRTAYIKLHSPRIIFLDENH